MIALTDSISRDYYLNGKKYKKERKKLIQNLSLANLQAKQ